MTRPTDVWRRQRAEVLARAAQDGRRATVPPPIRAEVDAGTATLYLYDVIDSWGAPFGVSARDFVRMLAELDDGVRTIRLHINSPGGEVFEGIAMLNALRQHDARVEVVVDGLAASAASVVAMGGDEVVMMRNAELMIHDPWGICIGDAEDMRDLAGQLDKDALNLADVYAHRAGGSVEDWRTAMLAETWYSAAEAVAAGLADRVENGTASTGASKAHFDLSLFAYAGRVHSPDPFAGTHSPTASAGGTNRTIRPPEGSSVVEISDEQLVTLREQAGVTDPDADLDTILAANTEALTERADVTPAAPTAPVPEGFTLVESATLTALREGAEAGTQARAQQLADERDRTIAAAVHPERRITPASRADWVRRWDADPDGTRALLAGLPQGLVPTDLIGHSGAGDSVEPTVASIVESDAYKNWSLA